MHLFCSTTGRYKSPEQQDKLFAGALYDRPGSFVQKLHIEFLNDKQDANFAALGLSSLSGYLPTLRQGEPGGRIIGHKTDV